MLLCMYGQRYIPSIIQVRLTFTEMSTNSLTHNLSEYNIVGPTWTKLAQNYGEWHYQRDRLIIYFEVGEVGHQIMMIMNHA